MKIYLIDPKKKWCKANLHSHSTNSDGYFKPEEIKKIYKKHGYKIVAYTDHEMFFDVSYLTDKDFVAITAAEYSITDNKNPANNTYVNKDEHKVLSRDLQTIHLCMFSKDPHNTFHFATGKENITEYMIGKYSPNTMEYDGCTRVFTKESIQDTINKANERGCLVQFNHPNWSLNARDVYIDLKGIWGFEILNYATELETGGEYCVNIYDDLLRNGHHEVCTMNDDNHNIDGSMEGSFGGYNYIGVNELNYENVIKAMEKGDIYCSNGPIIKSLYLDTDDGKFYIETSKAEAIIAVGYNRTFRHYYGKNLTKADFKIFGGEVYFRFTVRDKYGRVAHTHAYFLKDYGYE